MTPPPWVLWFIGGGLTGIAVMAYLRPPATTTTEARASTNMTAADQQWTWAGETAQHAETAQATRTIVRIVYRDGGAVAERTETTERTAATATGTSQASATAAAQTRVEYRDRVEYRESKAVPLPDWSLSARVGRSLDGGSHWGGGIERRILGQWYLGAAVDVPGRVGFVTTSWRF